MKETKKGKGFIFFDKDTSFNGVIDTPQLVLEGSVIGAVVSSETVFLRNGSFFQGEISTRKILAEEGAIHKGSLHLDGKRRKPPALEQLIVNNGNGENGHKTEDKAIVIREREVVEEVEETPVMVPSDKPQKPAIVEKPVVRLW